MPDANTVHGQSPVSWARTGPFWPVNLPPEMKFKLTFFANCVDQDDFGLCFGSV